MYIKIDEQCTYMHVTVQFFFFTSTAMTIITMERQTEWESPQLHIR